MQFRWIGLLALTAVLAVPGSGSTPKVTLSLEQATLAEACAAVTSATGVRLTVEPLPVWDSIYARRDEREREL